MKAFSADTVKAVCPMKAKLYQALKIKTRFVDKAERVFIKF